MKKEKILLIASTVVLAASGIVLIWIIVEKVL